MPSIEEILASLEGENADSDEEDATPANSGGDNKTIKAIRDHAKKLERELSKAAKELGELREFRQEVTRKETEATVTAAFKEAGIEDKFAKLFLRVNGDEPVTAEAITGFVQEYGLGSADGSKSTTPTGGGFAPTPGGEAPGSGKVTKERFRELMKSNPGEAQRLLNQGQVEWNNPAEKLFRQNAL